MNQHDDIIEVGCPNCGAVKKARRGDNGKRVRCGCGAPFTIELPSVLTIAEAELPVLKGGDPRSKKASHTDDASSRRACPVCGEMIVASAVKCRFCGEKVGTPTNRRGSADFDDAETPEPIRKKFCHECGRQIRFRAEICPHCGVRQADGGDGPSRSEKSRETIKTALLISAISNIVVGLIWLCTIIGVVLTVPMVILCICEFGLRSKADDLPLGELGEKAKTMAIFEIVIGLFNTPTFVCGILTVINSGKLVKESEN